jgi:hypothetical protein
VIINRAAALEQSAATFGGCAADLAREDIAQSIGDLGNHAFHSAVHDYLLHGDNDEWRRWNVRGWVAWPESRLLEVRSAPPETNGK